MKMTKILTVVAISLLFMTSANADSLGLRTANSKANKALGKVRVDLWFGGIATGQQVFEAPSVKSSAQVEMPEELIRALIKHSEV